MRQIEEFTVPNGKGTAYIKNIKSIPSVDLRIAEPRKNIKETQSKDKITFYSPKLIKIASLIIAGTITITSLSGCNMVSKEQIKEPINTETVAIESVIPTKRISYKLGFGENLWYVAAKCYDSASDQANMIDKIVRDNNIANKNYIPENTQIYIDVPYDHLSNFGYTVSCVEPSAWEQEEHFITEAWSNTQAASNNNMYERDRQMVFEGTENNPGYLISIASLKDKLDELTEELKFFNGENKETEQNITEITSEINHLYQLALELTEQNTYKKYGMDYVLPATYMITGEPTNVNAITK